MVDFAIQNLISFFIKIMGYRFINFFFQKVRYNNFKNINFLSYTIKNKVKNNKKMP